jgi:hypothetical protein
MTLDQPIFPFENRHARARDGSTGQALSAPAGARTLTMLSICRVAVGPDGTDRSVQLCGGASARHGEAPLAGSGFAKSYRACGAAA